MILIIIFYQKANKELQNEIGQLKKRECKVDPCSLREFLDDQSYKGSITVKVTKGGIENVSSR